MVGIDHATVAKVIFDTCRGGTVSIKTTTTIKSLQEAVPEGPSVAFYAGQEIDRDDSLETYSYRVPIIAKCSAASYQDCLNVAEDVKNAYHYWGYNSSNRYATIYATGNDCARGDVTDGISDVFNGIVVSPATVMVAWDGNSIGYNLFMRFGLLSQTIASITSANLHLYCINAQSTGSAHFRGITGTIDFSTVATLNALSYTAESRVQTFTTSGETIIDVTSIVNEYLAASPFSTSSGYFGFRMQATGSFMVTNLTGTFYANTVSYYPHLALSYPTSQYPSRVVVQTGGVVEHKNNNMWEKTVNLLFLFNGVDKNIT